MDALRWWDIARLRLRSLARRGQVESELDRELRFHLEQEIDENRARGMTAAEARSAALRRLGGVAQIQEECRDMLRTQHFEILWNDLRYSARTLAKTPGFAVVIVLTLALSIGANSAIFSVIDGVLLRPLPYPRADRIVRIFYSSDNFAKFPMNLFDFRDFRARNQSFGCMALMTRSDVQLSGEGEPVKLRGFRVTAGFFRVLGLQPARGREFTTNDELPGNGRQVILSDRVWRRQFASAPDIVGRKITLDAQPFSVAGVMPPAVQHPGNDYHAVTDGDTVDVWWPLTFDGNPNRRGDHWVEGIGRLKDGIAPGQAQAELNAIMAELAREHEGDRGWRIFIVPLYQELVGASRHMLLVLLGAVGLVLLIACVNAANLLLSRATVRQRETAVRAALGARRSRLVGQMLTESLLIAVLAGGLGAALAVGGVRALVSLLPADFPRASAIHVNGMVFAFTLSVALATGLLFGLAPALQASHLNLQQALRETGRGATGSRRHLRLRNLLVVGEVGLACVLLIGAGLLLRSFVNLLRADPGFRPQQVLTAALSLPDQRYKTAADISHFYDRLVASLKAVPGVQGAGVGTDLPWTGYDENLGGFLIEGQASEANERTHARYHVASEDYFRTMGTPLLRGRFFDAHDNRDAPAVLIINQAMAQRYWPNEDAVGKRISFDDHPKEKDWFRVVGVVGDVKDRPNSSAAQPAFWWPLLQLPWQFNDLSVAVRSNLDPDLASSQLRRAVRDLDSSLAVGDLRLMDQIADSSVSAPRFTLFLVGLFAGLALSLAVIGMYGVISYSVNQRLPEFGMRMALGASSWDVMRLVLGQGARLAATGIALGLAATLALARILGSLLYHVGGADPLTFAVVSLVAATAVALACYMPARRATRVDPMSSLRSE